MLKIKWLRLRPLRVVPLVLIFSVKIHYNKNENKRSNFPPEALILINVIKVIILNNI